MDSACALASPESLRGASHSAGALSSSSSVHALLGVSINCGISPCRAVKDRHRVDDTFDTGASPSPGACVWPSLFNDRVTEASYGKRSWSHPTTSACLGVDSNGGRP